MQVHLPQSNTYPLVKITAKAGSWSSAMLFDQSHSTTEVAIPKGIDESEVEIRADFCNGRGEPVETGFVVKHAAEKPKAAPKPKVEKTEVAKTEVTKTDKPEAAKSEPAKTE